MPNRLYRFLFLWGLISLLLLPAPAALAVRGPQGVSKTVHNLSSDHGGLWDQYHSDNEDQVCIFCHTPHGGSLDGPLWNRNLPGHGFTHYTSATLSSAVGPATRSVGAASLLCLSCHDGSIALNRTLNNSLSGPPTIGGGDTFMAFFAGILGALIGNAPPFEVERHDLLTDDHPISFSYQSSQEALPEKLHSAAAAMAAGVRFFGTGYQVECSSCHDPHVNYDSFIPESGDATADERYRPFLITVNTGSALCLACHNK